jgi:hypothetical protein
MWFSSTLNEIRANVADPKPVFEELKFRLSERRILKDKGELPIKNKKWLEAFLFQVVDVFDAIEGAIRLRESRKTWWERVGKRILRVGEYLIIIVGSICLKKI